MSILIIAEHDNHHLKPSTAICVAAAKHLYPNGLTFGVKPSYERPECTQEYREGNSSDGKNQNDKDLVGDIYILVAGDNCTHVAEEAALIPGIKKVWSVESSEYKHFLAENLAQLIVTLSKNVTHILAPATTLGKNLLPRVAVLLDVAQISDVTAIESENVFKRPIYAGNAIATVSSSDPIKVMTIRTTAFDADLTTSQIPVPIEVLNNEIKNNQSRFVSLEASISERPELTSARVIVSGGRGLQSSDNFRLIEQLADKLGAAIGASRAAVDAGFVPNDYQVGQTGKVVAPELYIAIGISGAIQHLSGMKDSKVIVAINKDPDAPIFQVADYGLVGDLFEIVPEFIRALG